jgi:hypothetical protein
MLVLQLRVTHGRSSNSHMVVAGEDCVPERPEGTEVTANNGETEKRRQTESILLRSFSFPPLLAVFSAISAFSFLTRYWYVQVEFALKPAFRTPHPALAPHPMH